MPDGRRGAGCGDDIDNGNQCGGFPHGHYMPGRYAVDYVSGYGSLCFVSSMGTSPYRHMAAESYCCGTYDRSGSDQRAGGDVAALYGRMGVQANERERFLADHRQCGIVGSVVRL